MRAARLAPVLLAALLLAAGAPPALAGESSARYTGGGVRADALFLEADLAAQYGPAHGVRLGGAAFGAAAPDSVEVRDDSGRRVGILACQDTNGDLRCGAYEPYVAGCGHTLSVAGFAPGVTILVFPLTSYRCGGPATTGTITLRTR